MQCRRETTGGRHEGGVDCSMASGCVVHSTRMIPGAKGELSVSLLSQLLPVLHHTHTHTHTDIASSSPLPSPMLHTRRYPQRTALHLFTRRLPLPAAASPRKVNLLSSGSLHTRPRHISSTLHPLARLTSPLSSLLCSNMASFFTLLCSALLLLWSLSHPSLSSHVPTHSDADVAGQVHLALINSSISILTPSTSLSSSADLPRSTALSAVHDAVPDSRAAAVLADGVTAETMELRELTDAQLYPVQQRRSSPITKVTSKRHVPSRAHGTPPLASHLLLLCSPSRVLCVGVLVHRHHHHPSSAVLLLHDVRAVPAVLCWRWLHGQRHGRRREHLRWHHLTERGEERWSC